MPELPCVGSSWIEAMLDEGYIKFNLVWEQGPAPEVPEALLEVRDRLHALGLVGMYADSGIGFGNVSVRCADGSMVISGSGTGAIAKSTEGLFSHVVRWDIATNQVWCCGPVPASSESLTHAMLYACDAEIGAVLHVHDLHLWKLLLGRVPTTGAEVAYGTPEMALEVRRLYQEGDLPRRRMMAMAGHAEGLVAFGRDCFAALEVIEEYLRKN
jgi:L-ribulose-5-phosphate 4-epimerase